MSVKKSSVRLKDKRRRASYFVYGAVLTLVLSLVCGVAYLTRLPGITIERVQVTGATRTDVHAIEQTVAEVLDGTYALLIPKRLRYVVPRGAVAAAVLSTYPTVQAVAVERTATQELSVRVTERTPHALWCGDSCYSMDAYGFVFDKAVRDTPLRTYRGGTVALGETFLDGEFHDFDRLVTLIEGVAPARVPKVRLEGADAFLLLEDGGEIRILQGTDPALTVARLEAVFSSDSFDETRKLDYVELRFADKALVKFRE